MLNINSILVPQAGPDHPVEHKHFPLSQVPFPLQLLIQEAAAIIIINFKN